MFWVCLRASSQLDTLHEASMPEPPQLTPVNAGKQHLYSKVATDGLAPHSVYKAEPSHPLK